MLLHDGVPVAFNFETSAVTPERPHLICFSHLRWDFVFQRPQHLMSRFSRSMTVIFWEEPIEIGRRETAFLKVREAEGFPGVRVVVPHLPEGMSEERRNGALRRLLDAHLASLRGPVAAWYYTPMMLDFSRHIEVEAVIYDCMDELSKFRFAPERLLELEQELIDRADIVFTGGSSLYAAKKGRHPNVHCFPSSVDRRHFGAAREKVDEPADQAHLPRPRLGFFGVLDERFDVELLDRLGEARPGWSLVMVGPVVKIAPEDLPRRPNVHYLGPKSYAELPAYLAGWDVALMPFAMNESTEFISPTKTPEYLAGGKPVVSTPVRDVVRHYGHLEGVEIATTAPAFVAACEQALKLASDPDGEWLAEADVMLSATSWDVTQSRMAGLVDALLGARTGKEERPTLVAAE